MRVSPFVVLFALCTSACTLTERNIDELRYPGFVDVGAGYAVAFNTRDGANNDADGYLLSLKAYPFGRWYSKPKSTEEKQLGEASEALVKGKVQLNEVSSKISEAKKHVEMAKVKNAKAVAGDKDAAKECADCLESAKAALESIGPVERVKPALERLKGLKPDARPKAAVAPGETQPEPQESVPVSADDLQKVSDDLAAEEKKVEDELDVLPATIARLSAAKDDLLNEEFYVVNEEGDTWWEHFYRRISVFYGTSMGNFQGGGLDSSVNVIGIGIDLAPQLAILVGWGYYDVDDGLGGSDTDNGLVAGISLNLAAFRWMFSELGN